MSGPVSPAPILAAHFREGALVKKGDLLVTIDPAPYDAEVERQQAARSRGGGARHSLQDRTRSRPATRQHAQSSRVSELDQRTNAFNEAQANLQAAKAARRSAQLNLDYTEVRAPVSGRVGKLEITTGNLVAAGPGAPVLTNLVSVDPIYVSFSADEQIVARALASVPAAANGLAEVGPHPGRDQHRDCAQTRERAEACSSSTTRSSRAAAPCACAPSSTIRTAR